MGKEGEGRIKGRKEESLLGDTNLASRTLLRPAQTATWHQHENSWILTWRVLSQTIVDNIP